MIPIGMPSFGLKKPLPLHNAPFNTSSSIRFKGYQSSKSPLSADAKYDDLEAVRNLYARNDLMTVLVEVGSSTQNPVVMAQLCEWIQRENPDLMNESIFRQSGNTLLHSAIARLAPPVVAVLLANGSNPTIKNKEGQTAIQKLKKAHQQVLERLLKKEITQAAYEDCYNRYQQILNYLGSPAQVKAKGLHFQKELGLVPEDHPDKEASTAQEQCEEQSTWAWPGSWFFFKKERTDEQPLDKLEETPPEPRFKDSAVQVEDTEQAQRLALLEQQVSKLSTVELKLAEIEAEKQALKQQLRDAQADCEGLEQRLQEVKNGLANRNQKLETINAEKTRLSREQAHQKSENKKLKQELDTLKSEKQKLQTELRSVEKQKVQLTAEFSPKLEQLQAAYRKSQAELAQLKEKLATQQNAMAKQEGILQVSFQKRLNQEKQTATKLKEQIQALELRCEQQQNALKQAKKDEQSAEQAQGQISKLNVKIEKLNRKIAKLEASHQEVSQNAAEDLAMLEWEKEGLEAELQQKEDTILHLQNTLAMAVQTHNSLMQQIQSLQLQWALQQESLNQVQVADLVNSATGQSTRSSSVDSNTAILNPGSPGGPGNEELLARNAQLEKQNRELLALLSLNQEEISSTWDSLLSEHNAVLQNPYTKAMAETVFSQVKQSLLKLALFNERKIADLKALVSKALTSSDEPEDKTR